MSADKEHKIYRFVVVYCRDGRDSENTQSRWRGWVKKVPDATESAATGDEIESRSDFADLEQLPETIRKLVNFES